MRVYRFVATLALAIALAPAVQARQHAAAYTPRIQGGWEVLFDGRDLSAWDVDSTGGVWAIDDLGALYVAKAGPNLYTKRRYCDFVLEADFRIVANRKCNSGVFIHVHDKNDEVNTGMEIQILDDAGYGVSWDAMNANGALYDLVHPAIDANKPVGEWEHFRITVNGSRVDVALNGKPIVKADIAQWTVAGQNPDGRHNKFPYAIASLPREGFIGLQNYGGVPVWFRNIRIRQLTHRQPKFTGAEPIKEVLVKTGS